MNDNVRFDKNFIGGEKYIITYTLYQCFGIPKKTLPASNEKTQLFETHATFRCT